MRLSWDEIKPIIDDKNISVQWIDLSSKYWIHVVDGSFKLECFIHKTEEPSQTTDFETNYKPNGNKLANISDQSGIKEPKDYRGRLKGIASGTATKTTQTDFWHQMEQLAWVGTNKNTYFDGVMYFAKDAVIGDYVNFKVVDKDGLVYPAGTELEEFSSSWYVVPNVRDTIRLFKSKMAPGFYIKIEYHSVGTTNDVGFLCNIYRFIKTDEDA